MNYNSETLAQRHTMTELAIDSKNYKSLFEEIAQNDTKIYLTDGYADDPPSTECCCWRAHRRSSFVSSNVVASAAKPFNIPTLYNTIWISEMKNATDYIEYLNETRRNSFYSLNKDNRSNYYRLLLTDSSSMNTDDELYWRKSSENIAASNKGSKQRSNNENRFLQVPKITIDEQLRRTPEFEDISKKIDQIHKLDSSVSTLIYKSIEVHADILVSGLTCECVTSCNGYIWSLLSLSVKIESESQKLRFLMFFDYILKFAGKSNKEFSSFSSNRHHTYGSSEK